MTRSVVQLGGQALKLDADGDTTIQVSTDDILIVDTAGNEALKIDATGHVTKPLQPAFLVRPSGSQDNVATGGVTVNFGTEFFDVGSNFASNTFTAPVTGKYYLGVSLRIESMPTNGGYVGVTIETSNRVYHWLIDPAVLSVPAYWNANLHVLADLDVNDTASINLNQQGGTTQTDVSTDSHFSGYLVC